MLQTLLNGRFDDGGRFYFTIPLYLNSANNFGVFIKMPNNKNHNVTKLRADDLCICCIHTYLPISLVFCVSVECMHEFPTLGPYIIADMYQVKHDNDMIQYVVSFVCISSAPSFVSGE